MVTFFIKRGGKDFETYASVMFDSWGNPLDNRVKFVDSFDEVESLSSSWQTESKILCESGDLFQMKDGEMILYQGDKESFFDAYNHMITNTLWVFNNELYNPIQQHRALLTGGGLSWLWQLNHSEEVTVCDISKIQIQYINSVLELEPNVDFGSFVYDFVIKNKIVHFHINTNETQDKNVDKKQLLRDRDGFVNTVNDNLQQLLNKYFPGKTFNDVLATAKTKKLNVQQSNIFDAVKQFKLSECHLSNTLKFKYNFCNKNITSTDNLLSPATKMFIKHWSKRTATTNQHIPPCLPLKLSVPVDDVHNEILKAQHLLVPHREDSGTGWNSFCIHGQAYNRTREDEYYKDNRPHTWTPQALSLMPHTVAWLQSLNIPNMRRVRVMCLEPLGFINLHRDQTASALGPINVAITHPQGCEFYLENHGVLSFAPGTAYMMNLVNHHTVVNNSLERRFHIIIHGDTQSIQSSSI